MVHPYPIPPKDTPLAEGTQIKSSCHFPACWMLCEHPEGFPLC